MAAVQFSFDEFISELQSIEDIASSYLQSDAAAIFYKLRSTLQNLRQHSPIGQQPWIVELDSPLKTKMSPGSYMPSSEGQHTVWAEISWLWEISCDREGGGRRTKSFRVTGNASTKVTILQNRENERDELAMWRFEIGHDTAPGCHFHVQILGEKTVPPFPHSLDVPRLPTILVTPMAVIEYVLAELFQDEWPVHIAGNGRSLQNWQSIQKRRLGKLFDWCHNAVRRSSGSPWTTLKMEKPPIELFT